jgi:hypothetical protein
VGLISDSQSNNNTIYHNNFNNIITNAKDAGINHWNLSYPNGGNYWHDYSGKDIYHGPNNQYPDGEGIGDTPYPIINGINQDIYPLMNEWIGESTLQIPITTATPPIQIYNGYVNISCKVIGDISDLNSIYLYLHHPDGIQENKSVIQNQTYLTYYCNRTFSKNGTYTFNFWAIDTKGNIISSNIQYFWITSNYSIIELQSGNNVINITDEITISLNITQSTNMTYIGYYENPYPDAVRPPDTLDTYFNIAVDNESTILWPINITMYYIQHDLDESNVTENNLIGLFYWNETNEKWEFYNDTGVNTTDINNFAGYLWANAYHLTPIVSSGDITPPEILMINTNPNQQILGEYINITCIVEDNVNISQVQISIYDPSINNSNISMNPIPGTNTYYYTMKYFTPGQYTFSIWVCDGNRNGITSATHSFIILDVTSPSIQDHSISIAYTDDNFIFNTTVTDNIEVTTVTIEYWYEFNNHVIANMENINGNYWDKTILIENTLNHLFYYISSNDRSNNSDSNTIREIIIIDNKPPIINNTASVPSTQNIGEYLNISSNITDNIELEKIYLFIEYPDQHNENISIIQNKTNDIYFCNRTYPQPGIYTYHIWAADTSSNSNISTDYTFEITSFYNNPPYIPSSPDPENGETDVDVDYDLNWIGGDPDNDPVTYDVYFGTSGAPAMVVNNQSATIYNPGTMSYSTKYYWKIVSWDNHGASTTGPVWDFTTKSSYPPVFGTPSPANSSTNNSLSLTWSIPINDPEGDVFSWTIQCSNGQTISGSGASNGTKSLQLSGLAYSTTYKVWVNATDPTGSGLYTKKWYTFTTQQQQNVPPNKPNKPSGETNGKINTPYTYSTSTTDPNGDQVYYMWDWGDGMQSSWLGPYNSGVTINTTHTWTIKGSYSIKVKAKDTFGAESPWSDPFPITMPLDLVSGNTSLLKQLNQSPNVFPLLRQLLIR